MASLLSKVFGDGTQSSPVSQTTITGIEAKNDAKVVVEGYVHTNCVYNADVINFGSSGNPEQKKLPIPLHISPTCSKFFCGRGVVLHEIKKSISLCEEEETSLQRIVAITGFGGMGKSEIAKVLAKELKSKYEYIFWFDAQTKISLEHHLHQLAYMLKIPSKSKESNLKSLLWDVYQSLAENYKNGILIFDNVEVVKGEDGEFALENYLFPDSQPLCKKPVFIVTSRNLMDSGRDGIKCVRLDPLSEKESQQCMLSILGIESQPLTSGLKKGISSLVNMSEGHPLGLTLIGQGLYDEVKDSLLDETNIESRVRSYIKLLKDSGLKDIPGQSSYKENVQRITDLTIEKVLKKDKGNIAVELLNIVALLSPDNIHVGLVNGIYCEKPFETHEILCPQFLSDDLEATVRSGLKLLLTSSLLKIESKAYEDYGYQHKYDMIKIHRLIQQGAQNRLIRQNESMEPLEKILRFTEQSLLGEDHVHFLLKFFLRNKLAYVHPETCSLQILGMYLEERHMGIGPKRTDGVELLDQVRDVLRTKKEEFHPDCSKALCLFETSLDFLQFRRTFSQDYLDQLKCSIEELSPEFSKQRWLLRLVKQIVDELHNPHGSLPQEARRWAYLANGVVKHYTDVKDDSRRDLKLTKFVLRHDCYGNKIGNCDWSVKGESLSKLFDCTSEIGRVDFWNDVHEIIVKCCGTQKERKQLLKCLLTSPGTNSFSRSLQFSQDSFKDWFIINIPAFLACVWHVTQYTELKASLLATEGFVSSLWDLTEFGFRRLSSSCEYMNSVRYTWCFKKIMEGLGRLLGAWCFLFADDVDLYRHFGEKLDSEVEDLLGCPWVKKSIYKLSDKLYIPMEYYIKIFSEALEV